MGRENHFWARADVQAAALCCLAALASGLLVLVAGQLSPGWRLPAILMVLVLDCAFFALLCAWRFAGLVNPFRRDMVNLDQLTRLKSRNAYEVDLSNLEARRRCRGVGVILMDLDNLKRFNDLLGHAEGDRYLRLAADVLWDTPTARCAAYRIGGDEFVLLLQDAEEPALERLAADILARFERVREREPVEMRLSVGWAVYDPRQDGSLRETCARADCGMYRQKRSHHRENAEQD